MSAELLREAAALMRDRATAATPGPWEVIEDTHREFMVPEVSVWSTFAQAYVTEDVVSSSNTQFRENATHIASWPPAVALAVAAWIDTAGADLWAHGPLCCPDGCMECDDELWMPHVRCALAIARAFLGRDA